MNKHQQNTQAIGENKNKQAQKQATKKVFKIKNIPFRSFEVLKKNEETFGFKLFVSITFSAVKVPKR